MAPSKKNQKIKNTNFSKKNKKSKPIQSTKTKKKRSSKVKSTTPEESVDVPKIKLELIEEMEKLG